MSACMTTALIITTYNAPQDLRCTLRSVGEQSAQPDEIIIADDGSDDDTRMIVDSFRPIFGGRLKHIWQPDEGFQLSRIRNRAIAAAKSDYIIMVDGDVVLHRHYIRDHVRFAHRGCIVAGMRAHLGRDLSQRLRAGEWPALSWRESGIWKWVYAVRMPWLTSLLSRHHHGSLRQFIGCNMAFWRDDAVRVNGFDETFTAWGEEDREFVVRMYNVGVRRYNMLFAGIQFHLSHPSRKRNDSLEHNGDMLRESLRLGLTRCSVGLDRFLRG